MSLTNSIFSQSESAKNRCEELEEELLQNNQEIEQLLKAVEDLKLEVAEKTEQKRKVDDKSHQLQKQVTATDHQQILRSIFKFDFTSDSTVKFSQLGSSLCLLIFLPVPRVDAKDIFHVCFKDFCTLCVSSPSTLSAAHAQNVSVSMK